MSPSLRPWKPASFSTIPVQRTRALSAYVAQAASETSKVWYLEPMALTATGIVIFWLGWNAPFISRIGWFLEPLGAGCVLVALFQKFRLDRGEVSSDIRKVYLFRHLRKLDQSRRSVGLDLVLNPETALALEESALEFEKIQNSLSDGVWQAHPAIKSRIHERAMDEMGSILMLVLGNHNLLANSVTTVEDHHSKLSQIASVLYRASNQLSTYHRPDELSIGASLPTAFPEVQELFTLVDYVE